MTLLQTSFLVLLIAVTLVLAAHLLFGGPRQRSPRTRREQGRKRKRRETASSEPRKQKQQKNGEQQEPSKLERILGRLPWLEDRDDSSELVDIGGGADQPSEILNERPTLLRTRSKLYHYTALVTDVYDGDTITVDIDLGLNMWLRHQRIRLWKVNTPELKGDHRQRGLEVRDLVRDMVLHRYVVLRTILDKRGRDQTGKYGRLLGEILLEDEDGEVLNINEYLLSKGLAQPFGADGAAVTRSAPAATPMPGSTPGPASRSAPQQLPLQKETLECPYCGEERPIDLNNQVVLNCPNCMDGAYWYSSEEQEFQSL